MNIAVQSLAGAPALSPIALPADAADEPIVALIKAYETGIDAYNASSEEGDDLAEATNAKSYRTLVNSTPEIQSAFGAAHALRLVLGLETFHCNASRPVLTTILRFLESAAGADLVHPDAELLALDARLAQIIADRNSIELELNMTDDEASRLRADRTGFQVKPGEWLSFDRYLDHGSRKTFNPAKVTEAKLYDLDEYDRITRHQVAKLNARLVELKAAAQAWRAAIEDYDITSGRRALEARDDVLGEEEFAIKSQITACRAMTAAGMAVKAKIVKCDWDYLWTGSGEELYPVDETVRSLVDDVLSLRPISQ